MLLLFLFPIPKNKIFGIFQEIVLNLPPPIHFFNPYPAPVISNLLYQLSLFCSNLTLTWFIHYLNDDRVLGLDPDVRLFPSELEKTRNVSGPEVRLQLLQQREQVLVAVAGSDTTERTEFGIIRFIRLNKFDGFVDGDSE